MRKLYLSAAIALAAIAAPAVASAATAYATANVNMRSGPSTEYPPILVVPASSPIEIYGCLSAANWCDVAYGSYRGWISGSYLQTTYSQQRIYVGPQYYEPLGIPTVTFSIDSYWDRHYRSRDFYRDRDRWREPAGRDRDRRIYVQPDRVERDDNRRPPRVDNRNDRPDPRPRPSQADREDNRPVVNQRPPRADSNDNRRPPRADSDNRRPPRADSDNRRPPRADSNDRPARSERNVRNTNKERLDNQDNGRACPPGDQRCVRPRP
ncbi:SH3 domain-containing protein [Rhizobium sp. CG5]|uniref:SH3 domain-containing protein n=1 Tax=Rhizobium sp. CG5 TaxID=2726076 RepID=UPI0020348270|nr:SH3 domain-containing protein [Rhizobium sp. CG5]MCM2475175.1 SH3 domain-containing protein [Rhizobium sp. CG5]